MKDILLEVFYTFIKVLASALLAIAVLCISYGVDFVYHELFPGTDNGVIALIMKMKQYTALVLVGLSSAVLIRYNILQRWMRPNGTIGRRATDL